MTTNKTLTKLKKTWKWIWNSDSILSWIVALIIIFIFVKYIFFPSLSLIMGTSLPLAGVESSSMDHQIVNNDFGILGLCGQIYLEKANYINFDEYWNICGSWYEANEISKTKFSKFSVKNGFRKGDIVIVWGRFQPKIGDVIIFQPNKGSLAPRPIVHRIVKIDDGILQTKGDHNEDQLTSKNNVYKTDETNIKDNQLIGKVIFKIPYLGWFKIWITDLFTFIF